MENSNICQRHPTNNPDEITCPSANGMLNPNQEDSPSAWTRYRPRGSLARALHDKVVQDQYLRKLDKNEWYQCDLSTVSPELRLKFVQLGPDEDTLKFIDEAEQKSDWIFTQIWHMLVKLVLGWFMTQTSINGWLQRGSMFVISQPQLMQLLKEDGFKKFESVLDLGAGDGKVTEHFAPLFEKVYATEISPAMRGLLQKKGFSVLDIENWHMDRKFDIVSCLNLIDRCDRPQDLLEQIRSSIKPNGLVLLAVVLPFTAYVETGSQDHKPQQFLPIQGHSFEEQVQSILDDILKPAKFELVSWSRVPYLCEGDLRQSYYWLDDAIFVIRPI